MKIACHALFTLAVATAWLATPQSRSAQAAASPGTVTCKDGTTATTTGKGACSHHGGVAKAVPSTTAPSTTAPSSARTPTTRSDNTNPAGAIAKCKDGTYSPQPTMARPPHVTLRTSRCQNP